MSVLALFYKSDNIFEIRGLVDNDAAFVNTATVNCTLVDAAGAEIAGETWPKVAAYIAASDGDYDLAVADTVTVTADQIGLVLQIDADDGAGRKGYWEIDVNVVVRKH